MKIRMIEPEPPDMNVFSMIQLPRLGLPMIGAALTRAGHDVRIYCACVAPIDWDDVAAADLVGISTTTSTAPAAYELGRRGCARAACPSSSAARTSPSWPTRRSSTPTSWRAARAARRSCSS